MLTSRTDTPTEASTPISTPRKLVISRPAGQMGQTSAGGLKVQGYTLSRLAGAANELTLETLAARETRHGKRAHAQSHALHRRCEPAGQ